MLVLIHYCSNSNSSFAESCMLDVPQNIFLIINRFKNMLFFFMKETRIIINMVSSSVRRCLFFFYLWRLVPVNGCYSSYNSTSQGSLFFSLMK